MNEQNAKRLKRLLITCGGTGGHFYPGLSIARTFQQQGGEIKLLLGGKNVIAQKAIAESYGIEVFSLPLMESPRSLRTLPNFLKGIFRGTLISAKCIKTFQPDAILGMGSFASLPPLLAAKLRNIPLFLHDGNAKIGKANRLFSFFSLHLGSAFPPVNAAAIHCRQSVVGMPIRPELLGNIPTKAEAIAELNSLYRGNLQEDLPTILIFGGSQGAKTLNENIPEGLCKCQGRFQVLHLAGKTMADSVHSYYAQRGIPAVAIAASERMELFYAAADLVFSRSGGSSVAELLYFGKYAILIPYPYASELHQNANAAYMASLNAATVVENADCTPEFVHAMVMKFLANPEQLRQQGQNGRSGAAPYASETELNVIEQALQQL